MVSTQGVSLGDINWCYEFDLTSFLILQSAIRQKRKVELPI